MLPEAGYQKNVSLGSHVSLVYNSENYNKIENELNNLYNKFSNSHYNELDEIKNKLTRVHSFFSGPAN